MFPIMHHTKDSFDEIDILWDVVCVFSECFIRRHPTLRRVRLLTASNDASRSNEVLCDERYVWAGRWLDYVS